MWKINGIYRKTSVVISFLLSEIWKLIETAGTKLLEADTEETNAPNDMLLYIGTEFNYSS